MKVDKLTQLFEKEKTLDDYKNKIKEIKYYYTFTIEGSRYTPSDKHKEDLDEIEQDYNNINNKEFLLYWSKALQITKKKIKELDFNEDGYLSDGIGMEVTYRIYFFDNSSLHIDMDSDGYIEEVETEEEGKMADDFVKDCDNETLTLDRIDLENYRPQKFIAPQTTKPKVDID